MASRVSHQGQHGRWVHRNGEQLRQVLNGGKRYGAPIIFECRGSGSRNGKTHTRFHPPGLGIGHPTLGTRVIVGWEWAKLLNPTGAKFVEHFHYARVVLARYVRVAPSQRAVSSCSLPSTESSPQPDY